MPPARPFFLATCAGRPLGDLSRHTDAGFVVSSKNLEINTDDERVRTDVRNNKVHADALRTCTRHLWVDCAGGGKRTGAKVMTVRAKRFRVKMITLKRLRQAAARVARLVKTAAVPSLICGADVTGMPKRGRSREEFAVRSRTSAAWILTSCSKMQGLTLAGVVQLCGSHVATCVGRALGPSKVDDGNLAGGLGEGKGLHQSLEARGWSRVRCCLR